MTHTHRRSREARKRNAGRHGFGVGAHAIPCVSGEEFIKAAKPFVGFLDLTLRQ
jgi:hypothetical protein